MAAERGAEDPAAIARRLLGSHTYMTMATAGADGDPWVSPVYFAAGDRDGLLWVSEPGTRHSLNIAARPRIAVGDRRTQVTL